jgi:hypothetical protein
MTYGPRKELKTKAKERAAGAILGGNGWWQVKFFEIKVLERRQSELP